MGGYKIYKGRIEEVESYKFKDGITSYKIHAATSGLNKKNMFKNNEIFHNIKHGFVTDPEGSDGLYKKGTLVYFIVDDANDGTIIAATLDNPGVYDRLDSNKGVDISNSFTDVSEIPLTPGDWIIKKLEGFISILYSGLIRLRANLETEIILDPIMSAIHNVCKRFKLKLGSHGLVQFSMSEDQATANFDFLLFNDTSGTKTDGSIIHMKVGEHEDNNNRVSLTIADTLTGEMKHNIQLSKDGKVNIFSKEIDLSINDKASLTIDREGKIIQKQVKLSIGNENAEENLIRGRQYKENYDSHLDAEVSHKHIVIPTTSGFLAVQSVELLPLKTKKLQVGVELAKDKFID